MKDKKSKKIRCRIQLNGKRWYEYFDTHEEALAYKEKIFTNRTHHYKKGEVEYRSLLYVFNKWLEEKSLEWKPSTVYNRKRVFLKVFAHLKDKWFHHVSEEECISILKTEPNIHNMKFYVAFQTLDDLNSFVRQDLSMNCHGVFLDLERRSKSLKVLRKNLVNIIPLMRSKLLKIIWVLMSILSTKNIFFIFIG